MSDPVWPVSVKGVVLSSGRVLLGYNDRDEWDLPGGRLEAGETLRDCVVREVFEETGIAVRPGRLLDSFVYEVVPGKHVVVIVYRCQALFPGQPPRGSHEHARVAFVAVEELRAIRLPTPYRMAIEAAASPPPPATPTSGA